MIEEIIEILKSDLIIDETENIKIARGKNKLITTFGGLLKEIRKKWQK